MTRRSMLSRDLIQFLRGEFQLDWQGIHGAGHWARVRVNGLLLARRNGADAEVVELFAFLHDARRLHDGRDRAHGARAAELMHELQGRFFSLGRSELLRLEKACREHSEGDLSPDVTVQTCWDADRLDLGRVGIRPRAQFLGAAAASDPELIESAYRRSIARW